MRVIYDEHNNVLVTMSRAEHKLIAAYIMGRIHELICHGKSAEAEEQLLAEFYGQKDNSLTLGKAD